MLKKLVIFGILIITSIHAFATGLELNTPYPVKKRVLMIVTSNSKMGDTGKATGIWAEELATPYYIFMDAGIEVEIASPKGGRVSFDPASLKPTGQNEASIERFMSDPVAQQKVTHTLVAASIDGTGFDALFFPGGHGGMWDLPGDAGVTNAVEAAFAANKVIAAVCHGPAGLVTAKRPDGKSILFGKQVNGFTNDEETEVKLSDVVPFKLETRLRELGGKFEKAPNWQAFVVRDGQFITGQNPNSAALVAKNVVSAIKRPQTSNENSSNPLK
ncbi:type 1 glutamine amidotransferase domain-containing protein [Sulfurirhabdus autotrophica]|uniref:Putative intracellular protease/amidase n=1 Tax=Sulfurirhabdus autotrophica TaxID=1706046 RepID=A0A4R3XVA4_9PROT|nr:type 1 glutamine amidotransferase domain-containing protein [Sulfurirhabdus autotrophica]TCV79973.1 putative intracellular protease/amidase [Sulfurirhabdus autotrophica]